MVPFDTIEAMSGAKHPWLLKTHCDANRVTILSSYQRTNGTFDANQAQLQHYSCIQQRSLIQGYIVHTVLAVNNIRARFGVIRLCTTAVGGTTVNILPKVHQIIFLQHKLSHRSAIWAGSF